MAASHFPDRANAKGLDDNEQALICMVLFGFAISVTGAIALQAYREGKAKSR